MRDYINQGNVFIIAEIGKNFIQSEDERSVEEYLQNAKALIKAAKEAGADAVKFQTHEYEDEQLDLPVVAPHFSGSDRYAWVKRNTLATPPEFWIELKRYADEVGIIFFSTPMSRSAAQKLHTLEVPLWKVGSGDMLDFVMHDFLASTKKPIILSTGMSTLGEIDQAVSYLKKRDVPLFLMHCVSKYPAEPHELNLGTIKFLEDRYGLPIGFSDHSIGSDGVIAAVNLGAKIIEKHFSFSRDLWGSDHKVSMTPAEFSEMVRRIREKEKMDVEEYVSKEKMMQEGEEKFRPFFRKGLVYGQNLKKDVVLEPSMIYAMRPLGFIEALPSEKLEEISGKKLRRDVSRYEPIRLEDFE